MARNFRDVEITRCGMYRDSRGHRRTFNEAILDRIVSAFSGAKEGVQNYFGHDRNREAWAKKFFGVADFGAITALRRVGGSLRADLKAVPNIIADVVSRTGHVPVSPEYSLDSRGFVERLTGLAFEANPSMKDVEGLTPDKFAAEFAHAGGLGFGFSGSVGIEESTGELAMFAEHEEEEMPKDPNHPADSDPAAAAAGAEGAITAKIEEAAAVAVEKKLDEEIEKKVEEKVEEKVSEALSAAAAAAPAAANGAAAKPGAADESAFAAFGEKIAGAVKSALDPVTADFEKRIKTVEDRSSARATEERKREITLFCERMVGARKLAPAEVETQKSILFSASDEIQIEVDGKKRSQYAVLTSQIEARRPLWSAGERVGVSAGTGDNGGNGGFATFEDAREAEMTSAKKAGTVISLREASKRASGKYPLLAAEFSEKARPSVRAAV